MVAGTAAATAASTIETVNTSNATIPTLGTNVPDYQMVISINGEKYSLNLFKVV